MPNWVDCTLRISGDPDNIASLRGDLYIPAKEVSVLQQPLRVLSFDTVESGVDTYPLKNCVARTVADLFWGHKYLNSHHMINYIAGCDNDFDMQADISQYNTFHFCTRWSPPDKWVAWTAGKYGVNLQLNFANTAECEGGYVRVIDNTISWYNSKYSVYKRHFYKSIEEMIEFEEALFDPDVYYEDHLAEVAKWPTTKKEYLAKHLVAEYGLKEYLLMLTC